MIAPQVGHSKQTEMQRSLQALRIHHWESGTKEHLDVRAGRSRTMSNDGPA